MNQCVNFTFIFNIMSSRQIEIVVYKKKITAIVFGQNYYHYIFVNYYEYINEIF